MLKNRARENEDELSFLNFSDEDMEEEGFEASFSFVASLGVESIAIRFSSFIGGLFIFFYFLQRSDSRDESTFLFPAFIGLVLAIYLGFSAWQGFALIRVARKRRRDFYR